MKVLILGGTSLYGRSVVEKLLNEDHDVTLFTRGTHKTLECALAACGAQVMHGDRGEYEKFKTTFDAVGVHYDAILDNTSMCTEDVLSAVDTFKEMTNHYILCSSVAVYPDWNRREPYREAEANLDFVSIAAEEHTGVKKWIATYANGKRGAEKALVTNVVGLPYTILRPAVIEGAHDHTERTWYWVQRRHLGIPVILPEASTLSQHVFSEDLATFTCAVIKNAAHNKVYNVAGDDVLTLEDYLALIDRSLSTADGTVPVQPPIVRVSQSIIDSSLATFPPFYDFSLCVDNTAAKTDYGFSPTRINTWLPHTVHWELENCKIPEGAADSYKAELAPFLASDAIEKPKVIAEVEAKY